MSETNKKSEPNAAPAEAPVDSPAAASGQVATNDPAAANENVPDASNGPAATGAAVGKRRSSGTMIRKSGRQTTGSPIEQTVALKQSLREMLTQTSELIRTLKRQKKQSRMISSTLKSLKDLQQAG